MTRIAFFFIRKSVWAGGYNYLLNLFVVISLYRSKELQPVLFCGTDVPKNELNDFIKIKNVKVIRSSLMNRSKFYFSLIKSILFGSDKKIKLLFKKYKIEVIFENSNFFGKNIGIPAVAWIPDFQHRALPHLFSWVSWWKREIGFRFQFNSGRSIIVSSLDAKKAFNKYYPNLKNSVNLVRFASQLRNVFSFSFIESVKKKYSLPDNYLYMPNQFWKHKNHELVLKSLISLKKKGHNVVVVSSGKKEDENYPDYFREFYKKLLKSNLDDIFVILGLIPYQHVLSLMIGSKAVLNPSLYEGRSTTVEECLALKVPLILSDIKIHKEQVNNNAKFFSPRNSTSLEKVLLATWNKKKTKFNLKKNFSIMNFKRIKTFSDDFANSIQNTINFYN
jgi:glycosyltransferase involved in cell wall biosynthesis